MTVVTDNTNSAHCHIDNFTKANPMFDWLEEDGHDARSGWPGGASDHGVT